MKNKFLIYILLFIFFLSFFFIELRRDEALNPSVKNLLFMPKNPVADEENAFIALAGLPYIDEDDIIKSGKEYLKNGFSPEKRKNMELITFSYKNPCLDNNEADVDCINQIMAEALSIEEDINNNNKFFERYEEIKKKPYYINNSSFNDYSPFYKIILDITKLSGANNLLNLKKARLESVLNSIEDDMNFFKKICSSQEINLLDLMVGVALINFKFLEIEKILEDESVDLKRHNGYADRIKEIINIDHFANTAMPIVLKCEKKIQLESINEISNFYLKDEKLAFKDKIKAKLMMMLFKKNMSLNNISELIDQNNRSTIEAPLLGFPEYFRKELAKNDNLFSQPSKNLKEQYERYGLIFFKNYFGEILGDIAQPSIINYLAKLNDTIVRSHLLQAQLELRMLPHRPKNITEALKALGPECKNPYTGEAFQWDEEKNIIWAERVSGSSSRDDSFKAKNIMKIKLPAQVAVN